MILSSAQAKWILRLSRLLTGSIMKHPRFEFLGDQYPHALEGRFDRILTKIDDLWDRPEIDDYISDLISISEADGKGSQRRYWPKL